LNVLAGAFMSGPRPPAGDWSLYERLRPKSIAEVSAAVKRQFGIED
jgi:hypothetical protein